MAFFWMPPYTSLGQSTRDRLDYLERYVQQMAEQLSVVLTDIGEDNLSKELQELLQKKEG